MGKLKSIKKKIRKHKRKKYDDYDEKVRKCAFEMSEKFSYSELANREDRVWGWIELHYPDQYSLDTKVFDIALLYKKKDFYPKPIRRVSLDSLMGWKLTVLDIGESILPNYPNQPFSRVLVLAPNTFSNCVTIRYNRKWWKDGIPTKCHHISANASLLSWISYDMPFVVVTHRPGKNQMFYETKMESEDIKDTKIKLLTKIYDQARSKIMGLNKHLEATESMVSEYATMYMNQKDIAEMRRKKDFMEEYDRIKKDRYGEKKKINWDSIAKWSAILIGLVFLFIILQSIIPLLIPETTDVIPTTPINETEGSVLSILYKLIKFW